MPFLWKHIVLFLILTLSISENVWSQEEGLASFYHRRFHGRKSASGEILDMNELIAAHRTHPFGTYLRVTNLSNMKRVVVRVTDRGPFRKKRIIDLSTKAAEILDFKKKGLTRVRIEVVPSNLDLHLLDMLYPQIPLLEVQTATPKLPFRIQ
ncbi:MAG: septal ring lytic transglycosylase RlpA family protein [Parabacteroides sp.]|nr:septal ring lytic transglycosylase RlpA family protein [Parabacteroides sp.]